MPGSVLGEAHAPGRRAPDTTATRRAPDERVRPLLGALAGCLLLAGGCAHPLTSPTHFGDAAALEVAGLGVCSGDPAAALRIDPGRPLVVLVHGCKASRGSYQTLARVFELHGQQTACFHYGDRQRITQAAAALRDALATTATHMPSQPVAVVGHSQGGLVARQALARVEGAPDLPAQVRLVTVSSPFAGIAAARHCGLVGFHVATLGTTVGVCRMVAGAKWNQIHSRSDLVTEPRPLASEVTEHLVIRTDERGTCRRPPGAKHGCEQDDFVFSVAEQENDRMQRDARVHAAQVEAGHVEIVGRPGREPETLIRVLQENAVLAPTPPERRGELAGLLRRLYQP